MLIPTASLLYMPLQSNFTFDLCRCGKTSMSIFRSTNYAQFAHAGIRAYKYQSKDKLWRVLWRMSHAQIGKQVGRLAVHAPITMTTTG